MRLFGAFTYSQIILVLALDSVSAGIPLAKTKRVAYTGSSEADYRLPTKVKPILYQIELTPNFEDDTFLGSINISIIAKSATNTVVLHKNQLEIDSASIRLLDEDGNAVNSVAGTSYSNDDKHFYTIIFKEALEEGATYTLIIDSFAGTLLHDDNMGFYLAKYSDENNTERKLATTQFEATHARRAFPCFDEPALKAQFEIAITRPAEYNSISNMPKISEAEISEGLYQDKFARTVKMSTYLVAFVVSDYANVSRLNHRVFGSPADIAANKADFALTAGIEILNDMSTFFNISYALPKMDQIAIPYGYFAAGAMENWGLVTYDFRSLMLHEDLQKLGIAQTIAHEFTHQWFGNLVSPIWWNYLWLSEGFAAYFQYNFPSKVLQDLKANKQFQRKIIHNAFRKIDNSLETISMNQEVDSPLDIWIKFSWAYIQPASVIRMVESILSENTFHRGLNIYLNKMKFQAAQPSDLYRSWQQALDDVDSNPFPSNENIFSVMNTWDSNGGYPLITINRNYEDGSVTISQKKFLINHPNNNDQTIWYVPITYTSGNNMDFSVTPPKLWLTTRSMEVGLDDLNVDDWLIVNIQQTGFYRVNYDQENWLRISKFLKTKDAEKIHESNRAQLLDDAQALSRAGLLDPPTFIELYKYIERETDYAPLRSFVDTLDVLDTYMLNTRNYKEYKELVINLLSAAVDSVGYHVKEDEDVIAKLTRDMILTWVCKYGKSNCTEYGLAKIRELDSSTVVQVSEIQLICAALRTSEQSNWDFVFSKYVDEMNPVIRRRLLGALGCSENEETLNRFLNEITSNSSQLRESDRTTALTSICKSGAYGRDYLYNYINKNWKELSTSVSTTDFESVIECIASKFSTEENYNDVRALIGITKRSSVREKTLKMIETNIDGANKFLPSLLNWVSESRITN